MADNTIRLAENEVVSNLGIVDNYWYLGLEQLFDTNLKIIRSTLAKVVTNRSGRVAKLLMSGKNKSLITNSWIMAKLRYYLATVRWSKRELISLDRVVRRRWNSQGSERVSSEVVRKYDVAVELISESIERNELTPKTAVMIVKFAKHKQMVERW